MVDDAGLVGVVEGGSYGGYDVQRLGQGRGVIPLLEMLPERRPLNVLVDQGQGVLPVAAVEQVEGAGDVRMVEADDGPAFSLEPAHCLLILEQMGMDEFERHIPAQHGVVGQIDRSGPAPADHLLQLVTSDHIGHGHRASPPPCTARRGSTRPITTRSWASSTKMPSPT